MFNSKKTTEQVTTPAVKQQEKTLLEKNKGTIKDIIAPGGVDASYTNHLAIVSSRTRYARSMIVCCSA